MRNDTKRKILITISITSLLYIIFSGLISWIFYRNIENGIYTWDDASAYVGTAEYMIKNKTYLLPGEYKFHPPTLPIFISFFMKTGLDVYSAVRFFFSLLIAGLGVGYYFLVPFNDFKKYPLLIFFPLVFAVYYPSVLIGLNVWSELFFTFVMLCLMILLMRFERFTNEKSIISCAFAVIFLSTIGLLIRYMGAFLWILINGLFASKKMRRDIKIWILLFFNLIFIGVCVYLKLSGFSSYTKIGVNIGALENVFRYLIPTIVRDNFIPFVSLPGKTGFISKLWQILSSEKALPLLFLYIFLFVVGFWSILKSFKEIKQYLKCQHSAFLKVMSGYLLSFFGFFMLTILFAPVWIETRMFYPFYVFSLIKNIFPSYVFFHVLYRVYYS